MDPFIKAMFGAGAIQVPLHFVIQDQGEDTVAIIGACKISGNHPLRFGSKLPHQLFLGDAVFRPRLVCETGKLVGIGLAGIAKSSHMASPDDWDRAIIIDGMPASVKLG